MTPDLYGKGGQKPFKTCDEEGLRSTAWHGYMLRIVYRQGPARGFHFRTTQFGVSGVSQIRDRASRKGCGRVAVGGRDGLQVGYWDSEAEGVGLVVGRWSLDKGAVR